MPARAAGGAASPAIDEEYCRSCGEIIKEEAVICPHCGVRSSGQSGPEPDSKLGESGYTALGIVTAVIALFFVPILFGGISMFSGYQIFRNWSEQRGIGIMILGGVSLVLGVIFGVLAWI